MIAARQIFLGRGGGAKAPTAADYVQDGLIAMWDGIENAGWGLHDAAATSWVDLTGRHNLTQLLANDSFGDNYFYHGSAGVLTCDATDIKEAILSKQNTIELVIQKTTQNVQDCGPLCLVSSANPNSSRGWWIWCNVQSVFQDFRIRQSSGGNSFLQPSNISWRDLHSFSFVDIKVYVDGVDTNLSAVDGTYTSIGETIQIGRLGGYNYWTGNIHSIRIYNHALTAAEIAANCAIDKARFNLPIAS